MKKWLLLFVLSMISSVAIAATPHEVVQRYVVSVRQNGKDILQDNVAVLPGKTANFSSVRNIPVPYDSGDAKGKQDTGNYASVESGLNGYLSVSKKKPDIVHMQLMYSRLLGMKKIRAGDHLIQMPKVFVLSYEFSIYGKDGARFQNKNPGDDLILSVREL